MDYATVINQLAEEDQQARGSINWDLDLDMQHAEKLKEIVKQIGWPTISKVGAQASFNAWLIVQHADHDPTFQKQCLNLIKQLPANEVNQVLIPYLEDRIRVNTNQRQLYGTQIQVDQNGTIEPYSIEDFENLDIRRAKFNLGPFAEYIKYCQHPDATFDGYLSSISREIS
jgi:hypothetical protein